ncbi:MAG: hypothetical protein HYR94_26570 [Chloroflexi bacterium]|nr:hypothetical protein [Chloroflexota bacterium]
MGQIWYTTKGFAAGAIAFVACPCHLPITLPLLISLIAGTAFGTWLADERNIFMVGGISTLIFIGGLGLAFKWTSETSRLLPDHKPKSPQAMGLTSSACVPCEETKVGSRQVRESVDFKLADVDFTSPK